MLTAHKAYSSKSRSPSPCYHYDYPASPLKKGALTIFLFLSIATFLAALKIPIFMPIFALFTILTIILFQDIENDRSLRTKKKIVYSKSTIYRIY